MQGEPAPGLSGYTVWAVDAPPTVGGDWLGATVLVRSDLGGASQPALVRRSTSAQWLMGPADAGLTPILAAFSPSLRLDGAGRMLSIVRQDNGREALMVLGDGPARALVQQGDLVLFSAGFARVEALSSPRSTGGLALAQSGGRVAGVLLITTPGGLIDALFGATITGTGVTVQVEGGAALPPMWNGSPLNELLQTSHGARVSTSAQLAHAYLPGQVRTVAMTWRAAQVGVAAAQGLDIAWPGGGTLGGLASMGLAGERCAIIGFGRPLDGGPGVAGVWGWSVSGQPALLVRTGDPLLPAESALTGASVVQIGVPVATPDGALLTARIAGPGVTLDNDFALLASGAQGWRVVLREGQALGAPVGDASGAWTLASLGDLMTLPDFTSATRLARGADGAVLAQALVQRSGAPAQVGVVLVDPATGSARVVLHIGQVISVPGGATATVGQIDWPLGVTGHLPTSGDDGALSPIGRAGRWALRALLQVPQVGGRWAILTGTGASAPSGCGPSDVAGAGQTPGADGQLTADDIVVFVGWFFASDPRADVSGAGQSGIGDGQFTADDLITFISRFFAGC
jgi:hypothetical protein